MKRIMLLVLGIMALMPTHAQLYDYEWNLDTMNIGGPNPLPVMPNSQTKPYFFHLFSVNKQPSQRYIDVNVFATVGKSFNYVMEDVNMSTLGRNAIKIAGGIQVNFVLKRHNVLGTAGNGYPVMNLGGSAFPVSINGSVADTLEISGGARTSAIITEGGGQNTSIKFNGATILFTGRPPTGIDSVITTKEVSGRFDTIIINKGLIASKDAGRLLAIGVSPAPERNVSRIVVVNGGSIDGIVTQQAVISGGSVRGAVNTPNEIKNLSGKKVVLGKLNKPNVEGIWVDGKSYNVRLNHPGTDTLYLYLTHDNIADTLHRIYTVANGLATEIDSAKWIESQQKWDFSREHAFVRHVPKITFASANLKMTYGKTTTTRIEFRIDSTGQTDASPFPLPLSLSPQEYIVRFDTSRIITQERLDRLPLLFNDTISRGYYSQRNAGQYSITIEYGGDAYNRPLRKDTFLIIEKDTLPYTVPTGLTALVLDSCKNITLPQPDAGGVWSWVNPTDTVGYVRNDSRRCTARFTPNDPVNYHTIDTVVRIAVTKRTPSVPQILVGLNNDTLKYATYHPNLRFPNSSWEWVNPVQIMTPSTLNYQVRYLSADTTCCYQSVISVAVNVLSDAIPTNLTATYGTTLSQMNIPMPSTPQSIWRWSSGSSTVGNVGLNVHPITFVYGDGSSNSVDIEREVTILVTKAKPNPTSPSPLTAYYGDTLQMSVLLPHLVVASGLNAGLDTGWRWASPNDLVGNAGSLRGHYAIYTPVDTANYDTIHRMLGVWVDKAYPVFTMPPILVDTFGKMLNQVNNMPTNWHWQNPNDTVGYVGLRNRRAWYWHNNDTVNYQIVDSVLQIQVVKARAKIPASPAATYGDLLSTIPLPVPWAWKHPDSLVGNVGLRQHIILIRDSDTANYIQNEVEIDVEVRKAIPVHTIPRNLTATYGDLLSSVHLWDATRTNLAERDTCWSWKSPNLKVGNAGMRQHEAIFTPLDTANYLIVTQTLDVYVKKAKPNPTLPDNLVAFTGDTLIQVLLPNRWACETFDGKLYGSWVWLILDDFVGDRGNNQHRAIFTLQDTANWDTVIRLLNIFVAKRTQIYVTNSTETKPEYWVIDSCTINYVDIIFSTDDSVKVVYPSTGSQRRQITSLHRFDVTNPSVYTIKYTLEVYIGSDNPETREQTLYIERKFRFTDIVRTKHNKMLLVDNNPLRTGYRFVSYQWYRSGVPVGDGMQYYYEDSNDDANVLSPSTPYSVTVTTEDGKEITTCDGYATKTVSAMRIYPNPVRRGASITLEFPTRMLGNTFYVNIYSISGNPVLTDYPVNPSAPQISTENFSIGIYVLKSELGETLFVVE